METAKRSAYGAATLYACIIGLSFLFGKVALESAQPMELLAHRFLTSFLALSILAITKTIKINLTLPRFIKLVPVGLFYPFLFFGFQTYGLMGASSSEAGIIHASVPVFVMLMAHYVLGEKLERGQRISVIVSVVGVIYILVSKGSSIDLANLWGIILLLCSVLAFSTYSILARKVVDDYSHWDISFVMQVVGVLLFNLLAWGKGVMQGDFSGLIQPLGNFDYVLSILYLGILSTLGTAMLYNFALSRLQASRVSVFGNLGTVISMMAGVLLLGEELFYYHIFGSILIIGGVIGTNVSPKPRRKQGKRASIDN